MRDVEYIAMRLKEGTARPTRADERPGAWRRVREAAARLLAAPFTLHQREA